jgi:hypothetical protein
MSKTKKWNVMIYLAGDNNLSADMAYTLDDLRRNFSLNENKNVNLFVYYRNNSPEIPAILCNFSNPTRPVFEYADNNAVDPRFRNKFPAGNPVNSVLNFVDWCVNQTLPRKSAIPSPPFETDENYALIFSGHTLGFLSCGLLKDECKDLSMTLPDLQKGLEIVTQKIIGRKLSLLGFDSCVMSMYEVGQQFRETAETMIASEGSIPNAGWSYAEIFEEMTVSDKSVEMVAADFVRRYIEKQSRYTIGGVSVDMAAWNLKNLDKLNSCFARLAANILRCFEDESEPVYRQMKRILLQVHYNSQTYMFEQCIDLGDFCALLIEELGSLRAESGKSSSPVLNDVSESARAVYREIEKCVILSGFTGGNYQFSTGISLFFPWSVAAYRISESDYRQLSFVKRTKAGRMWNEFLRKYLFEVSLRRAAPVKYGGQSQFAGATGNLTTGSAEQFAENPLTKIPLNPLTKIPLNPLTKIPLNPLTKISGQSHSFFENFTKFKNHESNWNNFGFTKRRKKNILK